MSPAPSAPPAQPAPPAPLAPAGAQPPLPPDDASTKFFWDGARAGELRLLRCQACGTYIHLPRPVCRNCQSFDLAPEKVSGRGTLYSYTVTFKAFHPFFVDRVPYVVATIALEEQEDLRILSNLVGVAEADIIFGMPVMVDFEVLSPELTIPVFRPALAASAAANAKAGAK
jgi:uncharacterized protein